MVFITGDIHADINRYKNSDIKKLKKDDFLIVLGDFGFIWDGTKKERSILKWIEKCKFTTLFIEGIHENHMLLANYPDEQFCGGTARKINNKIYQLKRGEIFNIDGKTFFAFGGGESFDETSDEKFISFHTPTYMEMENATENLKTYDNCVDYVVTHFPNKDICRFLNLDKNEIITPTNTFFNDIANTVKFKHWYFGYHHIDKQVSPLYTAVFKKIIKVL